MHVVKYINKEFKLSLKNEKCHYLFNLWQSRELNYMKYLISIPILNKNYRIVFTRKLLKLLVCDV